MFIFYFVMVSLKNVKKKKIAETLVCQYRSNEPTLDPPNKWSDTTFKGL
jgi:hypothetical protein